RQQEMQFGVFHYMGLNEQSRSIWINTSRQPINGIVDDHRTNTFGGIVVSRQRMPIDDTVETFVLILQTHPIVDGADKMAQMQFSCRPHAAKNSRSLHIQKNRKERTKLITGMYSIAGIPRYSRPIKRIKP